MARVVVTGGAGFIGSELVAQLVGDGHRVVVLDNLINGRAENIAEHLGPRCDLLEADVRDAGGVAAAVAGAEVAYHLACLGVRHSIHSPFENHEVNAGGTLQVLQACRSAGVRRFVYVSSSEVYGTARRTPMTEDHPTFPETVYGASKLAGEHYARAFWRTHRFPTVMLRPFNAFGPRCHHEGDSGEVIPKFLLRAMAGQPLLVFGDGTQTRDFTYVSDTATALLRAGFADSAVGRTINVGSGQEIAIDELARQVTMLVGRADAEVRHVDARPGDVHRLLADSTTANELLGFRPRVPFVDGLRRLHAWYLARPESSTELLRSEIALNWKPTESGERP